MKHRLSMLFIALLTLCMLFSVAAAEEEAELLWDEPIEESVDAAEPLEESSPELEAFDLLEDGDAEALDLSKPLANTQEAVPNADSGSVSINAANFPDANFRDYVRYNFDIDRNGVLSEAERKAVTAIYVSAEDIDSLEGIRLFPYLQVLACNDNNLTSLNLSGCSALYELYCSGNQLTSLDLSGFSALQYLEFYGNPLTSLDLSGCSALQHLDFSYNQVTDNQLTHLNLNGCSALKDLDCSGQALTDLNLSGCSALQYLDCSYNQLTNLNLSGCSALQHLDCYQNQLTGLNLTGCSALEDLGCSGNQLTSLNLSACSALKVLACYENQLTSLNLTGYSALERLYCDDNQLTSLNLTNCFALEILFCRYNLLTSLNLSGYSALKELDCGANQLTSLNLTDNPALESLDCSWNQLTSLNLSGCSALEDLACSGNQLTSLNLSGCSALEDLACSGNQLTSLNLRKNPLLSYLWCSGNRIPYIDITDCTILRNNWKDLETASGLYFDRSTAVIVNGKPIYGTVKLSGATVSVPDQVYTGKALKPAPTVKLGSAKLKKGTAYTVSYRSNAKIGTAKATLKGKGGFTGSVTVSFNILPRAVRLSLVTGGKGQIGVMWKKGTEITGYELQRATKKDFSDAVTKTVSKAGTTQATLKKLKANTKYYVRVRAYKKVGSKKYYSAWSAAKSAKAE